MNRNNFYLTENTQKATLKLWILYKWHYVNSSQGKINRKKTMHLHDYYRERNETGMQRAERLVDERKLEIEQARVYDNRTKNLLRIFDPKFLSLRDATKEEILKDMNKTTR